MIFLCRPSGGNAFIEQLLYARYRGLSASVFPSAFGNITATEIVEKKPAYCQSAWRKPLSAGSMPATAEECEYRIGTGALIRASEICSNPAHPGTIPIKTEIAQELQFQADTVREIPQVFAAVDIACRDAKTACGHRRSMF